MRIYTERKWEQMALEIPGVMYLEDPKAREILQEYKEKFYYSGQNDLNLSYGYFYFTGRRGAFLFVKSDTCIPFCWHPNMIGQALIYPPIGPDFGAVHELLDLLPTPPNGARLARFDDAQQKLFLSNHPHSIAAANVIAEDILDWRYPLHTISTEKSSAMPGTKKLNEELISIEIYQSKYFEQVREIGAIYAKIFTEQNPGFPLTEEQIFQSHKDMMDISMGRPDLMSAYVAIYDGAVQGFFVIEEFNKNHAINLWYVFNGATDTLPYAQMAAMCRMLQSRGIQTVNLGGSETESMDFFKTRFQPVRSIAVKSIDIMLNEKSMPIIGGVQSQAA